MTFGDEIFSLGIGLLLVTKYFVGNCLTFRDEIVSSGIVTIGDEIISSGIGLLLATKYFVGNCLTLRDKIVSSGIVIIGDEILSSVIVLLLVTKILLLPTKYFVTNTHFFLLVNLNCP